MQVGINHEFFRKSIKDYNNWRWAWIREIAQNSIDCGATTLNIITEAITDKQFRVTAINNGPPMTEDTLLGKFLNLGGTTKTHQNSVGGFGIAKLVIALAHDSYQIHTGNHIITGNGGTYEHTTGEYLHGTCTTVTITADLDIFTSDIKKFASYLQWSGTLALNGEILPTNLRKGSRRREFDFGTVYSNKHTINRVIIRVGGIPMFHTYTDFDRCVILELNSSTHLTANRDGLTGEAQNQLYSFLNSLTVDSTSALTNQEPQYIDFNGDKLCAPTQTGDEPTRLEIKAELARVEAAHQNRPEGPRNVYLNTNAYAPVQTPKSLLGHAFVIKNTTRHTVPPYYIPGSEFTPYSHKLATYWAKTMLEIHKLFQIVVPFSVGFIFSDDDNDNTPRIAEYEQTNQRGRVFYLNPCKINKGSFKKRFKLTDRGTLISLAAHELVHALGVQSHNEEYATKLTTVMAKVLDNRNQFNKCFR